MTLGPNEHPWLKFHHRKVRSCLFSKIRFPAARGSHPGSVGSARHSAQLGSAIGREGVSRSWPL